MRDFEDLTKDEKEKAHLFWRKVFSKNKYENLKLKKII